MSYIKKLVLQLFTLLLILGFMPAASHAILIEAGNIYRIDFDFSASTPSPPYDAVGLFFEFNSADYFDFGEEMTWDIFDEDAGPSLATRTISIPSGSATQISAALFFGTPSINDGVGFIIVSDIVGSFDVAILTVDAIDCDINPITGFCFPGTSVHVAGNSGAVPGNISVVPEPSTLLLLGSGLAGLGFIRRKFKV